MADDADRKMTARKFLPGPAGYRFAIVLPGLRIATNDELGILETF